jgi:hypothetical protein
MAFTITHELDSALHLYLDRQHLASYVYRPQVPAREAPKPYFHPLRSLAGDTVTLARPTDHPWHHGLSLSFAALSGTNFWGGPSYVRDRGYQELGNQGQVRHEAFEKMEAAEEEAHFTERLSWLDPDGSRRLEERRRVWALGSGRLRGSWTLVFDTTLTNLSAGTLEFGSPTTEGRAQAGYGSLFWRGPRSFVGGTVTAGGMEEARQRGRGRSDQRDEEARGLRWPVTQDPAELMGARAAWLRYTGQHDGSGNYSSLVFIDSPENPRYPTKWFVRNEPYAGVSFSFMFDDIYPVPPGASLHLSYRIVVSNGALSGSDIRRLVQTEAAR